MKQQIFHYLLVVFTVFANAQTIPKSINKPISSKIKKEPIKHVKEKIKPYSVWKNNYDYVGGPPWRGLYHVSLNNKWGFVNKNGKIVIPLIYDEVKVDIAEEIIVSLDNKWGLINETGAILIAIKYDAIDNFNGGLALVKLNGKCGFINKSDKIVVPIKYDEVGYFHEGLCQVKLNGNYGFVNKQGQLVIPIKYDSCFDFNTDGKASVYLNGKRIRIDKTGNCIEDCN
jgi:hypothetical protein